MAMPVGAASAYSNGSFTPDELKEFTTLEKIVEFLGIDEACASAFYAATGATGATMPRQLGVIELEELKEIVKELSVPGAAIVATGGEGSTERAPRKLNIAERGSLILLCKACRM